MDTLRIAPCLWFDGQAEAAARFYCAIFPGSRITAVTHYGEAGREQHRQEPGTVLTVAFELAGQPFTALNGGPEFRFNEAISFQVPCRDQAEIDRYWDALLAGGGQPVQCGWLKDRFGVSWQVFPEQMTTWLGDQKTPASQRVMRAMMAMVKMDLAALRRAHDGA
jgi:predicted 3-demethylubiquinone-9 3-methyltransferase (glyoxalase superfamily)